MGIQPKGRNIMSAPTFSPTTGDDIDSALDIIEQNGGTGEWEQPAPAEVIPRWLFPRFPGADERGTCDVHEGVHPEDDECLDYVADTADLYLSRSGLGPYDTDVETIAGWLEAPRNRVGGIMLLGEPGSGKSALAQAACTHADRRYTMLTATPDDTKDSLRMRFVGEGKGDDGTAFAKSSLVRAAEMGWTVIVDEFMLYMDGVKPLFYPLLDGSHWFPEANIDGTDLAIHPEFRVIVTANPLVRGASLPEPVASRFASTTITVDTSAQMLRDLSIDEAVVQAWEALGTANLWRPQIREMRMADYWLGVDPVQAVSAFLGEHAPESQRKAIRDTVVAQLGGNIREDGRLVVS